MQEYSYPECLQQFDSLVSAATAVSQAAAGRRAESGSSWWASVLFTRLTTTSLSLLLMLPRNRFVQTAFDHWDFAAIAAISRSLVESYFAFYYLCVDPIPQKEWETRWNIFNLHDCISRLQMFESLGSCDEECAEFRKQAEELRERLVKNTYFQSMPHKRRNELLKGKVAYLVNQDELLERTGEDKNLFRLMYRFLSSYVHTFPTAFYRMGEGDRGRGLESPIERDYICIALEFVSPFLGRAIREMVEIFPNTRASIPEKLVSIVYQANPLNG